MTITRRLLGRSRNSTQIIEIADTDDAAAFRAAAIRAAAAMQQIRELAGTDDSAAIREIAADDRDSPQSPAAQLPIILGHVITRRVQYGQQTQFNYIR